MGNIGLGLSTLTGHNQRVIFMATARHMLTLGYDKFGCRGIRATERRPSRPTHDHKNTEEVSDTTQSGAQGRSTPAGVSHPRAKPRATAQPLAPELCGQAETAGDLESQAQLNFGVEGPSPRGAPGGAQGRHLHTTSLEPDDV